MRDREDFGMQSGWMFSGGCSSRQEGKNNAGTQECPTKNKGQQLRVIEGIQLLYVGRATVALRETSARKR